MAGQAVSGKSAVRVPRRTGASASDVAAAGPICCSSRPLTPAELDDVGQEVREQSVPASLPCAFAGPGPESQICQEWQGQELLMRSSRWTFVVALLDQQDDLQGVGIS